MTKKELEAAVERLTAENATLRDWIGKLLAATPTPAILPIPYPQPAAPPNVGPLWPGGPIGPSWQVEHTFTICDATPVH